MFSFSAKRLAVAVSLAVATVGASGGAAQAILDHSANFSVTIPVTAVVPIGVCSAQAVATSNNVNRGDVERSDAKSRAKAESECDVANNVLRNVTNVLNKNITDNITENVSDNINHSIKHVLNDNIRKIANRGALIRL